MKQTIFIVLICLALSCYANENGDSNKPDNNQISFHGGYFTCGLGCAFGDKNEGLSSSRFRLGVLINNFAYSIDYTRNIHFRLHEVPYYKGALLKQENVNLLFSRTTFSNKSISKSYLSFGSGLCFIQRLVRDEPIFFENWTNNTKSYLGIPASFEITIYSEKTQLCFNINYRIVLYENDFYQSFTIDLGVWGPRK